MIVNGEFESNTGSFNTINGLLTATGNIANDGGVFLGAGTINGQKFDAMGGLISPGNSPGILTLDVGLYTQFADATLEIEIGGTMPGVEHDVLVITGDAILGGTLELIFLDGFLPGPDDLFPFLQVGGELTGAFDQINVTGLGQDPTFDLFFDGGALVLANVTVPEPGTLALFGLGLAGLGFARRKRTI